MAPKRGAKRKATGGTAKKVRSPSHPLEQLACIHSTGQSPPRSCLNHLTAPIRSSLGAADSLTQSVCLCGVGSVVRRARRARSKRSSSSRRRRQRRPRKESSNSSKTPKPTPTRKKRTQQPSSPQTSRKQPTQRRPAQRRQSRQQRGRRTGRHPRCWRRAVSTSSTAPKSTPKRSSRLTTRRSSTFSCRRTGRRGGRPRRRRRRGREGRRGRPARRRRRRAASSIACWSCPARCCQASTSEREIHGKATARTHTSSQRWTGWRSRLLTQLCGLFGLFRCAVFRSFVDAVGSLEDVEHKLERYSYDTKTRGHREIQPARLCGEARYDLIRHGDDEKSQTHLVYELEVPETPGDVQKAFSIEKEGQFLINGPAASTHCRTSSARRLLQATNFLRPDCCTCVCRRYSEEPRLQLSVQIHDALSPSRNWACASCC